MTLFIFRTGAIALSTVLLAGCSTLGIGGGGKSGADTAYVARDVGTLYNAAKDRLFDEVERQHPYSPWARRAQLMSAFSYYMSADYPKAIESSQRFLSIHPGNKDAPYAYYLIGISYYEQIADVRRDQSTTEQALAALGEVQRRYPETRYAADAALKIDLVNDHLAGKEMEIGRFYERRNQWLAATLRFREVVDKYETTTHAPEALYRLVESYLSLGIPLEAKKAAAVLGTNYPGSKWYERAYDLMQDKAPSYV